jgi:AraC family transcriptional regulator
MTELKAAVQEPLTPAHAPLSIFPTPPVRSSQAMRWEGLYVEHHQQPAYETPEYCYGWCNVSIHLGQPVRVEKWIETAKSQARWVREGDIGIYPANVRFRERCFESTQFVDIYLNPTLLSRAVGLSASSMPAILPGFAQRDLLVYQMGLTLKAELEVTGEPLYAESLATALSVHLLRRYTAQYTNQSHALDDSATHGLSQSDLSQAVDYIQTHFTETLSVAEVANSVQMSPYHFSRLFKQTTGLTPYQYILRCRVERAKRLLRQNLPIAEAAVQAGFASQSHLNRHFKQQLGLTPRQFCQ